MEHEVFRGIKAERGLGLVFSTQWESGRAGLHHDLPEDDGLPGGRGAGPAGIRALLEADGRSSAGLVLGLPFHSLNESIPLEELPLTIPRFE